MIVTTRFAPSPTGALHIGGARTALFNYLFAKSQGGSFLLRIEDTDRARSSDESVRAIFEGLEWLGLTPDSEPVFQSRRSDAHIAAANDLIEHGAAFCCHMSADDIAAERTLCHSEGRAFRSPWRDGPLGKSGSDRPVVRLRAPGGGKVGGSKVGGGDKVVINDAVRGEVSVCAADIDDMVLVRADGSPTYMLAVTIDDHHAGITHVIRGDDHLTNALRQVCITDAFGWQRPTYAHLPLIHGPDGRKLSKRHGDLAVLAYSEMGYLPEGMLNYLLRLGFSHGDQEIFTRDQAVRCFSLAGLGRSPARLDMARLKSVNAHHLRALPDSAAIAALDAREALADVERARIEKALPVLKERASTLNELADVSHFLREIRPISLSEADRASVAAVGVETLTAFVSAIRISSWGEKEIAAALPGVCSSLGVRMGQIGPPLRLCLSGTRSAPALASILHWLGRGESLARTGDQNPALQSAPEP